MDGRRLSRFFKLTGLTLMFAILLLGTTAMQCIASFHIQNQTDQVLTIYMQPYGWDMQLIGEIAPNAEIIEDDRFKMGHATYLIEAKNDKGDIVYSKEFTAQELIDSRWKVVIHTSDLIKQ